METTSSRTFSFGKLINGALMVFGTTVGAGMLGIPLMTAAEGFSSALWVTFLVWVFMTLTGLLLLEVTFHMPQGSNLISLARKFLGKKGQWLTVFLFLFLYYSLIVAYFAGGAPLLGKALFFLKMPSMVEVFLFLALFGGIVLLGSKVISKVNLVLSLGMLIIFPSLISLGSHGVSQEKLFAEPFSFSMAAVPVLFGAFGFHNVIPSLTGYLGKEKRVLRTSLILGTFLAFLLYVVWQWLVLGSLSKEVLKEVLAKGLPVTYALAAASSSPIFLLGQTFAFLALTTSFLGVSLSLVDFIQDGFLQRNKQVVSRKLCTLLALLPPFVCVLLSPHLFDRALGIAGGFGEAVLNGILPVLLFSKLKESLHRSAKTFLFCLYLFSLFVMFVELRHLL
jgi:tyrosine-specific transport protein